MRTTNSTDFEQVEVCEVCGGHGYIVDYENDITCCGYPTPHGSCCGNGVPIQVQVQAECPACKESGGLIN